MFTPELKKLILRVLSSWEVIVVTLALILYLLFVSYVARLKKRRLQRFKPRQTLKASQARKTDKALAVTDEDETEFSHQSSDSHQSFKRQL